MSTNSIIFLVALLTIFCVINTQRYYIAIFYLWSPILEESFRFIVQKMSYITHIIHHRLNFYWNLASSYPIMHVGNTKAEFVNILFLSIDKVHHDLNAQKVFHIQIWLYYRFITWIDFNVSSFDTALLWPSSTIKEFILRIKPCYLMIVKVYLRIQTQTHDILISWYHIQTKFH